MKRKIICLFLLSTILLSACGQVEKIEIPKAPDIPEMDELVDRLEPEETEEELIYSDEQAQAFITRGTYMLQNLDITGDGEKDLIEVVCYGESDLDAGYAKGWDIIVNHTLAYDLYSPEYMQPEISFYMIEEQCAYIAIKEYAPQNSDLLGFQLFQYKNEKIRPVCDFYEPLEGTEYEQDFYADIILAKAKEITLHCYSQSGNHSYPQWYMTYTYDGEWGLDSEVPIISAR